MRIYFKNLELNKKYTKKCAPYLVERKEYIKVYSFQGIFIIDNKNTYRLDIEDGPVIDNEYNKDYDMLVDYSKIHMTRVEQVGLEEYNERIIENVYMFDKKSNRKLVTLENGVSNELMYCYLDFPDNLELDDLMLRENINEFLSLLK